MNTTEDMKKRLQECIEILDNFIDQIKSEKTTLEEHYKGTYSFRSWIDDEGIEHNFQVYEFEKVYEYNIAYVNKQINFLNQVTELPVFKENKFSNQLKKLIDYCINQMKYQFTEYDTDDLLYKFTYYRDLSVDFASILILSKFSQIDGNVVLIGGNGSGKSSLAKTLKGDEQEHISVIPAQKTLYFSLHDKAMLATKPKEIENILLENNISKSKTEDENDYYQYQNNQFTKLIVAMREEYTKYLMICEEKECLPNKEKCVFGSFKKIFKNIFPAIELDFKSDTEHFMNCKKMVVCIL